MKRVRKTVSLPAGIYRLIENEADELNLLPGAYLRHLIMKAFKQDFNNDELFEKAKKDEGR